MGGTIAPTANMTDGITEVTLRHVLTIMVFECSAAAGSVVQGHASGRAATCLDYHWGA